MKNNILYALKLFIIQLLSAFASIVLCGMFGWVINLNNGGIIYSSATSFFYFIAVYLFCYEWGKTDGKSYNLEKYHPLKGLLIGLIASVPNIIVILVLVLSKTYQLNYSVVNSIARIYFMTHVYFLGDPKMTPILNCIIVCACVPLVSMLGYIFGKRQSSFLGKFIKKLVYKK